MRKNNKVNLSFFEETDIGCQEKKKHKIPLNEEDLMQLKREEKKVQFIKTFIPWQKKYTYEEFFDFLFKAVDQYGRRWSDGSFDLKFKVDTEHYINLMKFYLGASYNEKTRIITMKEKEKWRVLMPLDVVVKGYKLADIFAFVENASYDYNAAQYKDSLSKVLLRISEHFKMLNSWTQNHYDTVMDLGFMSIIDYYYEYAKVYNYKDVIKKIDSLKDEVRKFSVNELSEFLSSQSSMTMIESFRAYYYSGTPHDKFNMFLKEIAWLRGAKIKAKDYAQTLREYANEKTFPDSEAVKKTFQEICYGSSGLNIDKSVIEKFYKEN